MRLFKNGRSKTLKSSTNGSNGSSTPDVPPNDREGTPKTNTAIPEFSRRVTETFAAIRNGPPQARGGEKLLNKIADIQDKSTPSQEVMKLATAPKELMSAEIIKKQVNTLMDAVPFVMQALNKVAEIHPYIKVALFAFTTAYELEAKRRENNKKVLLLYAEMKNMMEVLIQLEKFPDRKHVDPDRKIIEGRVERLCEGVAKDIKECALACDTYYKKRLIVKILAGAAWEQKLFHYVEVFIKTRQEFLLALSIHVAVGLEELPRNMMNIMKDLFQEFASSHQKELAAIVEKLGGAKAVLQEEETMKKLVNAEAELTADSSLENQAMKKFAGAKSTFIELEQEIKGKPDDAIKKNAEHFNNLFDIQKREIEESFERAIHEEGSRIISELQAGPHDRIIDMVIRDIWKDMGWRGSVEARHFVTALKDHYVEMAVSGVDTWTFKYINIGRMRSVLEAFDEDASGFVTVNEVNSLTRSKPLEWSLPHWIAYWAIGWQMTCTTYCIKIEKIFDAMMRLAFKRSAREPTVFVRSIKREGGTESLKSRFRTYVDLRENKLRQNLQTMKYRIDNSDTIRVIAGEGNIETTLIPLFYLALQRDLEKIGLARKHVLSDHELHESATTILSIANAAFDRVKGLRTEPPSEGSVLNLLRGSVKYNLYNEHNLLSWDKIRELPDPIPFKDEIIRNLDSTPISILNHALDERHQIDFGPSEHGPTEGNLPMLGIYHGFIYYNGARRGDMITFTLSEGAGEHKLVANSISYIHGEHKEEKFIGNWGPPSEDKKVPIELDVTEDTTRPGFIKLKGAFKPKEDSLRGDVILSSGEGIGEFVFKRDADFVRFYPAPSKVNASTRWEFAVRSVRDRVDRQAWSSERILKRIEIGKQFMELLLKFHCGMGTQDDETAYHDLSFGFDEADVQFYDFMVKASLSKTVIFNWTFCINCGLTPLRGSRVICMDCHGESSVDLCSKPRCIDSTITFEAANRKPHRPNHRMFKVYRYLFSRDIAMTERAAKDALNSAREIISRPKEGSEMPMCLGCGTGVSLPCWCCVECQGKFICDKCEGVTFNETHTNMHTIVRVPKEAETERSVEERMWLIEAELAKMRQIVAELRQMLTGKGGEQS